ncbi:hypothetical protein K435DRAFT_870862, partial [Dendrothele bispora CBS 962.96]
LILTDFRKWWEDILPDRENDEEDWAPLDSVSGRNGMWKVICALTWVLFFVLGEELVDLTDEQTSYLAEWMVLADEIESTLVKVIERGVEPPRKRKSADDSEVVEGRVTRARFAKQQEVNEVKQQQERKSKKSGKQKRHPRKA